MNILIIIVPLILIGILSFFVVKHYTQKSNKPKPDDKPDDKPDKKPDDKPDKKPDDKPINPLPPPDKPPSNDCYIENIKLICNNNCKDVINMNCIDSCIREKIKNCCPNIENPNICPYSSKCYNLDTEQCLDKPPGKVVCKINEDSCGNVCINKQQSFCETCQKSFECYLNSFDDDLLFKDTNNNLSAINDKKNLCFQNKYCNLPFITYYAPDGSSNTKTFLINDKSCIENNNNKLIFNTIGDNCVDFSIKNFPDSYHYKIIDKKTNKCLTVKNNNVILDNCIEGDIIFDNKSQLFENK